MRRKPLPTYQVNGWEIEKCPNSFAEQFVYKARAHDADGYCVAHHGFQTLAAARDFCANNPIP